MDPKDLTQKSTKKEIWEAYHQILQELKNRAEQKEMKDEKGVTVAQPVLDLEKKKILAKVSDMSIEKISADISGLKIDIGSTLNALNDRLIDELKKLELLNQGIKVQNEELENVYKIKAEASMLLDLIEAREQKKTEFQREVEGEDQKLKSEIAQKKKQWEREQEEHQYSITLERRKEEDEYEFKKQVKEREFQEKIGAKEKELKTREVKILGEENEIKELKEKVGAFQIELERAKNEAIASTREEMEVQAKIASDLVERDIAKEREVAKLKITSLEETMKRQSAQIHTLESQLSAANQKAQELAVKIIESRGQRELKEEKRQEKENNG